MEGRRLVLSNLDKVLYPDTGFTKAGVINYYAKIAPVLLPHLRDRPVTLRRYPDGTAGNSFFEKNAKRGAPDWVRSVSVARSSRGDGTAIDYVVLCDLPSLVWAANLAALELHVPMWRAGDGDVAREFGPVDLMVFDLDPGAPASVVECCGVAGWLRQALEAEGWAPLPKTSGSKGLQVYVALRPPRPWREVRATARDLARAIEHDHPGEVVSNMRRDLRPGKVLIDWSQNHPAKTTVAPYSLRARAEPTVSTPVTWGEVAACRRAGDPGLLVFDHGKVLARVAAKGDLFAPLLG